MKSVNIYIGTQLKGPCIKDGAYAGIAEYITSAGPVTREIKGMEKQTTYYRSVLLAIVKTMNLLKVACSVTVYTDCVFVINTVNRGNPEGWMRAEWKKPSGEEVKNKELWQQFLELQQKHEIGFRFSKHNNYRKELNELIEGKRKPNSHLRDEKEKGNGKSR